MWTNRDNKPVRVLVPEESPIKTAKYLGEPEAELVVVIPAVSHRKANRSPNTEDTVGTCPLRKINLDKSPEAVALPEIWPTGKTHADNPAFGVPTPEKPPEKYAVPPSVADVVDVGFILACSRRKVSSSPVRVELAVIDPTTNHNAFNIPDMLDPAWMLPDRKAIAETVPLVEAVVLTLPEISSG